MAQQVRHLRIRRLVMGVLRSRDPSDSRSAIELMDPPYVALLRRLDVEGACCVEE